MSLSDYGKISLACRSRNKSLCTMYSHIWAFSHTPQPHLGLLNGQQSLLQGMLSG